MWYPVRNYPFAILVHVFNSLFGSMFLFIAACSLGYALTTFDPHSFDWPVENVVILTMAWIFPLIMSTIALIGIPFLLIHFWTLYRLFYTDDSRVNLFFIAFATQAAICILLGWIDLAGSFTVSWTRGLVSIGVIVAAYLTLKKLNLFRHDTIAHPTAWSI
jgi:hypothetical protein